MITYDKIKQGDIMYKLLVNGFESFNRICEEIDNALDTIEIRMFIWRDDYIGNTVLKHLNNALNRGVKVTIYKDIYGAIFEKGEELRQSMFHKETSFNISLKAFLISNLVYYQKESPRFVKQKYNLLLNEFLQSENLNIINKVLKDHTKYYIFDNKKLIIGGINIEDKEYEKDLQNRHYKDYMVLVNDYENILYFKDRLAGTKIFDANNDTDYIVNYNDKKYALDTILSLINKANKQIYMSMAYFGNKKISNALLMAKKRGVIIKIISSKKSNVQQDLNMKVFNKYYKNNIDIYLHNGLIHAKTMLIDDYLIVGSINLNNNSLKKLGECSIYTNNKKLIEEWLDSFEVLINESEKVGLKKLKYNFIKAIIENIAS